MSLNWKEIDFVLSELDLVGAQVQRIIQPSWDTIILSCYKPSGAVELLLCAAHGACRIHATNIKISKAEKPQRFMELLRARIKNSRITSIEQLGSERIIKISLGRAGSDTFLYARLWSGAANLILTENDGTIIDVLSRKPGKAELSGEIYLPVFGPEPAKNYNIREYPAGISFNEFIDSFYRDQGSALSMDKLSEKLGKYFSIKESGLDDRIAKLGNRADEYSDPERLRELGDILMANQGCATPGSGIELEDFYRAKKVFVKLDSSKSIVENAQSYYDRAKQAKGRLAETLAEIKHLKAQKEALKKQKEKLFADGNPWEIRAFLEKNEKEKAGQGKTSPGLKFTHNGWTMLVGRSAAENDELLRHHVKGNDLWLHARDYAGSYVFIKAVPKKSFPLELMLDAGMLALYYSKGRTKGFGDVYCTLSKQLKRVKGGPKGLVIPAQEKNLRVKIDEAKIRQLFRNSHIEED